IHVYVARPPDAGNVRGTLLERAVRLLKECQVVVGLHIGADGILPLDPLPRAAVAPLIDDAVFIVVDAVERIAGRLQIGLTEVARPLAVSGETDAAAPLVPRVYKIEPEIAVVEGVVVVAFGHAVARSR